MVVAKVLPILMLAIELALGINDSTVSQEHIAPVNQGAKGLQINITEVKTNEFAATNKKEIGSWAVYDTSSASFIENKERPCCLLAKMKAKVDIILKAGSKMLFTVPASANSENGTCSNESSKTQTLDLIWDSGHSETSNFGFSFDTNTHYNGSSVIPGRHFLSGVFYSVPVNLSKDVTDELEINSNEEGLRVVANVKNLEILEAPELFSFSCHYGKIRLWIPSFIVLNGQSLAKVNALVTLTRFEFEPFRRGRYYTDFTHLKFDCNGGWPYDSVVELVNGSLACFVTVAVVTFAIRFKRKKGHE